MTRATRTDAIMPTTPPRSPARSKEALRVCLACRRSCETGMEPPRDNQEGGTRRLVVSLALVEWILHAASLASQASGSAWLALGQQLGRIRALGGVFEG